MNATTGPADHTPAVESIHEAAYRELVRSRRHGRPLSLVVLLGEREGGRRPWRRTSGRGSLSARAAALTRRYDYVGGPDRSGRVMVLTPEQSLDEARLVAARLQSELQVKAAAASFPDDGASFPELLGVATGRAAAGTTSAPAPAGAGADEVATAR